jgi:hypothetical protein
MDPQQRLLLESCHEVIGHVDQGAKGLPIDQASLLPTKRRRRNAKGSGEFADTSVYVGISYNEYAQLGGAATPEVSTYTATGGSLSVAAGTPCPFCRNCICLQVLSLSSPLLALSPSLSPSLCVGLFPPSLTLSTCVCAHTYVCVCVCVCVCVASPVCLYRCMCIGVMCADAPACSHASAGLCAVRLLQLMFVLCMPRPVHMAETRRIPL